MLEKQMGVNKNDENEIEDKKEPIKENANNNIVDVINNQIIVNKKKKKGKKIFFEE